MDTSRGLISPSLGLSFDFEMLESDTAAASPSSHLPFSPQDGVRPGTSNSNAHADGGWGGAGDWGGCGGMGRRGGETPAGTAGGIEDFARAVEQSLSRPTTSGSDMRGPQGGVEFHCSLFPHKSPVTESATTSAITSPMTRDFIDSRDKPYSPTPTQRPAMMLANNSSPNLSRPTASGSAVRAPVMLDQSRMSPKISMQEQFPRTDYGGSTARPSTRASSGSPTLTIGTPYQETSSTFPLPQHVQTRPKNGNTEAMVAGMKVPTHHTSASPKLPTKTANKPAVKPAEFKRKTRLLNPLALLQRRRSEYPTDNAEEERAQRQAQAQALVRQRDVVASGVNKPAPDFDPRIKGKKVHDFSAPRGKRNTFDEANLPLPPLGMHSPPSPALTSPMSPMSANGFPPRSASLVNRGSRREQPERPKTSQRISTHTPVFVEHLGENPEAERRASSIHAENLENKDFLQRASKQSATTSHSQESAVLPPFARRSQILDPLQASLYQDSDSKRSSDPSTTDKDLDTSLSSFGDISPITARSSAQNLRTVSPSSLDKNSRPVSHLSCPPSHEQKARILPELSTKPSQVKSRNGVSDVTTYASGVSAPPFVSTIGEAPVHSSRIHPSDRWLPPQDKHGVTPNISMRTPESESPSLTERAFSPSIKSGLEKSSTTPTIERTPIQSPDASMKLAERRMSAVGHAKRSSNIPKKHASNASRFSFQLGESAVQEQALEEKHRKIVSSSGPVRSSARALTPEEDEDDYFDEDAMDDMDEMEMQSGEFNDDQPRMLQSSLYLHQARQALRVPASDDGSLYDEEIPEVTDERDVPYADHPSFRAHPAMDHHFARNSVLTGSGEDYPTDGYWRDSTLDSYMRDSYYSSQNSQHSTMQSRGSRITVEAGSALNQASRAPSFQEYLSGYDGSLGANCLSMPKPSFQVSAMSSPTKHSRPPLPARDSGNSERNRVASGMTFDSNGPTPSSEKSQWVADDIEGSDHHVRDMSFSTISEAQSSIANHASSLAAERSSDVQTQTTLNSSDVSLTPRPEDTKIDIRDRSSGQDHVVSPQLNRHALANLESGNDSGRSQFPSVASPKSARSFPSGGNCDASLGGPSLTSPKSFFSHKSAGSGNYETFTKDHGFSRVGSPHAGHKGLRSGSENEQGQQDAAREGETASDAPLLSGLGLSMFAEFDFDQPQLSGHSQPSDHKSANAQVSANCNAETAELRSRQEQTARFSLWPPEPTNSSRLTPREAQKDGAPAHPIMLQSNRTTASHYSRFSDASHSTADQGSKANYSPVRASAISSFRFPGANEVFDDSKDDMYFDDGNFEQDINAPHYTAFDENSFDDDAFLARPGMNTAHVRDVSNGAFSTASLGSDGPYPNFAMPNSAKARKRESQLLLEDLVLQDPIDPRLIPQRNPSEDAKRFGTSDRAPALPIDYSLSKEDAMHMQRNLDQYHSALANAANKAAAEGRFWRAPSSASGRSVSAMTKAADGTSTYSWDEKSDISIAEEGSDRAFPETNVMKSPPRPSGMTFDFGFDDSTRDDVNDYDYGDDDDLVAAANAEALASDDEGFYGQEFAFYGRPRANSNESNPMIGGYFGEDGDDGLHRNKSLREPNLTPITERSEFSTRNSVVGLGLGVGGQSLYGPPSAGLYGPYPPALARMSVTPLMESEMSFDELRKLRGQAFGGSGKSIASNSARSSAQSLEGLLAPAPIGRPGSTTSQPQNGATAANPHKFPVSSERNGSNSSAVGQTFQESPQSATSSQGDPFSMDLDLTPRKDSQPILEPTTAKKVSRESTTDQDGKISHSRNGSGADSVTYVREPDPDNSGKPRWVMERRRTSEQGQLQLIGRELVQGGWI